MNRNFFGIVALVTSAVVAFCGAPALAAYARAGDGGHILHSLQVFTVAGRGITRTTVFQSPDLFACFGLPERIGVDTAPADESGQNI